MSTMTTEQYYLAQWQWEYFISNQNYNEISLKNGIYLRTHI